MVHSCTYIQTYTHTLMFCDTCKHTHYEPFKYVILVHLANKSYSSFSLQVSSSRFSPFLPLWLLRVGDRLFMGEGFIKQQMDGRVDRSVLVNKALARSQKLLTRLPGIVV